MRAIRFAVDKRGRRRAYRWRGHMGCNAAPDTLGRWFPISPEIAELEISTGHAYRYERPFEGATPDDQNTN